MKPASSHRFGKHNRRRDRKKAATGRGMREKGKMEAGRDYAGETERERRRREEAREIDRKQAVEVKGRRRWSH